MLGWFGPGRQDPCSASCGQCLVLVCAWTSWTSCRIESWSLGSRRRRIASCADEGQSQPQCTVMGYSISFDHVQAMSAAWWSANLQLFQSSNEEPFSIFQLEKKSVSCRHTLARS